MITKHDNFIQYVVLGSTNRAVVVSGIIDESVKTALEPNYPTLWIIGKLFRKLSEV